MRDSACYEETKVRVVGIDPRLLGRPILACLIHCLTFYSPSLITIRTQDAEHFVSYVLLFPNPNILFIIFFSQIFALQPTSNILIKSLVATARSQSQTEDEIASI